MSSQNKALINFYARLIIKDSYVLNDVPTNLQRQVSDAVEELKNNKMEVLKNNENYY